MPNDPNDLRSRVVRKRYIKESVQRLSQSSARKAQREAKENVKQAKEGWKEAKEKVKTGKKAERLDADKITDLKAQAKTAKAQVKASKKIKKEVKKTNPTIGQKARQSGKAVVKRGVGELTDTAITQDDTLNDLATLRHRARQVREMGRQARTVGGKGTKLAYRGARSGVRLTAKGAKYSYRGAKKGAKLTRQTGKVAVKASQAIATATKSLVTTAASLMANPITWVVAGVVGGVLLLIVLISSIFSSNVVQQTEFSLNQSWLHISQMDRKKSSDTVDYYTAIDDILLYMNYRYGGEWEPDATWDDGTGGSLTGMLGFNHFSDALDDIWKEENNDPTNLKTMKDLYTSGKEWIKLDKNDLTEYQEIIESQTETGKYLAYQELVNPLIALDADSETDYLTITKRYGYTSKDEIDPTTTLQATAGQPLYAVMDGKMSVTTKDLKGNETETTNLIIASKEARFIYYDIGNCRVKTDDKVEAGDELGTVNASGQKIAYVKKYGRVEQTDPDWLRYIVDKDVSYGYTTKTKKGKKEAWVLVNPGFYFPFVTYSQITTVTTSGTDMSSRAKLFYQLMKQYHSTATDNGIASVVGCFAQESGVNPKRAEGDYLAPPVGASDDSWDDENWLSIGGTSIYNGSYANILHRGLGLGQWTDTADGATRHTQLLAFAKSIDKKWYDLETQVRFVLEGDSPYYQNILKGVLDANEDTDTLTSRFLTQWEGINDGTLAQRQSYAKQALSWFKEPTLSGGGSLASSWDFPESYRDKVANMPTSAAMTTQAGNGYSVGQCTWYAYNRLVELGEITDTSGTYSYLGNGQDWVRNLTAKGWHYSTTPAVGAVCSTAGGFDMTMASYGHVMIVEAVNADGSFLISECNYVGNMTQIHWRVCQNASYYTFATP